MSWDVICSSGDMAIVELLYAGPKLTKWWNCMLKEEKNYKKVKQMHALI